MTNHFDPKRRQTLGLLGAALAAPLVPGQANALLPAVIRKPIPSSNELLPAIGVGTARSFDVGSSRAEQQGPLETLNALTSLNNAMVDTSPMYGESERVIGAVLPQLKTRPDFFIATKVWTNGRERGIAQMNRSFELLGQQTLDLMQIHNLVDWQTHLKTLRAWKESGRIRYIGITHYREDAHAELMSVIQAVPDLDFVQINYSMLEPAAEQRLLPMCQDRGIAVIINRPFGRGAWFSMTRGQKLPGWASELGINSWAQFALKWVVSHPAVTCAIPGTSKAKHMIDNMQAARGVLPSLAQREQMFDRAMDF